MTRAALAALLLTACASPTSVAIENWRLVARWDAQLGAPGLHVVPTTDDANRRCWDLGVRGDGCSLLIAGRARHVVCPADNLRDCVRHEARHEGAGWDHHAQDAFRASWGVR